MSCVGCCQDPRSPTGACPLMGLWQCWRPQRGHGSSWWGELDWSGVSRDQTQAAKRGEAQGSALKRIRNQVVAGQGHGVTEGFVRNGRQYNNTARLMQAGEGMKGWGQSRSGGKKGSESSSQGEEATGPWGPGTGRRMLSSDCCFLGVFFVFSKMKNDVFVGGRNDAWGI